MSHVTLLCTVCEVPHHSLSKSLSILLLSLTLLLSVQLTLQEVLKHSDLFAGSSMTDSSFKLHWDEL